MRRLLPSTLVAGLLLAVFLLLSTTAQAQRPIGSVSTADANVGGVLETSGGNATILNNGTVTAHAQTAAVTLARGGTVNVCSTSSVHLSQSSGIDGGPLLLALDHGALEMKFLSSAGDAVLTPEMRIQPAKAAPLDLRIRVVSNGDTCIENRGEDAPVLMITDTFGEASYVVHAQQHVLFEHGDLKQVVDNESSPCGCPPAVVISVAESGVSAGANGSVAAPGSTVAADAHPFPVAQSEGLATMPAPLKATGHVSADLALTYNSEPAVQPAATQPATAAPVVASETSPAPAVTVAPAPAPAAAPAKPVVAQAPPPPPPPTDDLAQVLIRFYHWVFHRKSSN